MKKIGIISPSNDLLEIFPNRKETGIINLKKIGFDVIFSGKKELNSFHKNSIRSRIIEFDEILEKNPSVILASIGGYISTQLLDSLDYEKIKKSNSVFCGSSDITSLLLSIYAITGKIVLYGPTYTVNFCDYGGIDEYTKKYFLSCLKKENIIYEPSNFIVNEFVDWSILEKNNRKRIREKKGDDWKILKKGIGNGKLIGGNLITIMLILGTKYLPIELFENSILFLEDCETNINEFCSFMECLRLRGIFSKIKGLIIGKFDTNEMNSKINEFISDYFNNVEFPIISNVDFGHVFPTLTFPIGANACLKCSNNIELTVSFK